jgi:hypothetical protein
VAQASKGADEKFCHECAAVIRAKAEICPKCGVRQPVVGSPKLKPGEKKCTSCNYHGPMKTWLRNNSMPQFIAIVLMFFYVVPGLIFIAYFWNKYKCPQCGAVGKTIPA